MNVFSECVLAIDKIRGEHGTSMGEARVGKDCFLGNDSIFGRKKETIIVGSHVTGGWFTRNKKKKELQWVFISHLCGEGLDFFSSSVICFLLPLAQWPTLQSLCQFPNVVKISGSNEGG